LAELYDAGVGVEENKQVASSWFRKAAVFGDIESQYRLGKNLLKTKPAEAIVWLEKAANSGEPWAAYELGEVFFKGLNAEQDYGMMEHWLLLADEQMREEYKSSRYLSQLVRKTPAMKRLEKYRSAIAEIGLSN